MTIYAKLAAAVAAIGLLVKQGENEHFNYMYVRDQDVLLLVRKTLTKVGLAITSSIKDVIVTERKIGTKSTWNTRLVMEFTIADIEKEGETVVLMWAGEANDGQDKAVSKAATAAVKYFLLKLFLIPTGNEAMDSDSDTDYQTDYLVLLRKVATDLFLKTKTVEKVGEIDAFLTSHKFAPLGDIQIEKLKKVIKNLEGKMK